MNRSEFDKFADEYTAIHSRNIRASGENPGFFAEYKIQDMEHFLQKHTPVKTILDFGGGTGTSVPYVTRYFPEASTVCLDVSERSLEIARAQHPGKAHYVLFDGETIPLQDNSIDLAFAACVFHHIPPSLHQSLLEELTRVLHPGGWLFIFEHNPYNPLTRHAVNTCPFDENAILIPGRHIQERLNSAGLKTVTLKFRLFFPRPLASLRPIEQYLTWLPLGAQYYVCGQKS